jgi:hypothetical protein
MTTRREVLTIGLLPEANEQQRSEAHTGRRSDTHAQRVIS